MGVGAEPYILANLPPGKTWHLLYGRLDGLQGWSRQVQKILPPLGLDPRTVQAV